MVNVDKGGSYIGSVSHITKLFELTVNRVSPNEQFMHSSVWLQFIHEIPSRQMTC